MYQSIKFILVLMFAAAISKAQTPLFVPDTLSGSSILLQIKDSTHQFYTGVNTNTIGYNGALLGPTIILNQGQQVSLNVHNMMPDTTTTHWHGLHLAAMNDGSPHNPIMAGDTWSPTFTVMDKAATYWYHPHLHGKTMKQVVKGASGIIIVRDAEEAALSLPRQYGVDDFPLVCQFKTFDTITKQIVISDELDNVAMVNGGINNYLNVPAQMVRMRLLNGSSHRFFNFAMNDNRSFQQIAGDESLLDAPVMMTKLILAPGERAEIVVDFSGQSGNTYFLKQMGTTLPAGYPGGPPSAMMPMPPGPLDNKNFNLLQFNVQAANANALTNLPTTLTTNVITSSVGAGTRTFLLQGVPQMSMTNFVINTVKYNENVINFTTKQDSVMVWSITNQSMMPHPWHIHGNHFFIKTINGAAPPANMRGRKDVVTIPPQGGTVTLVMKYSDFSDSDMPYMYHCHILSHEDGGMMGQFLVNPRITATSTASIANNHILIAPNPSNSLFNITSAQDDIKTLTVIDNLGRMIRQENLSAKSTLLNLSEEAKGIYFVKIQTTQATKTIKIVNE
jgi:blue copper oxidase